MITFMNEILLSLPPSYTTGPVQKKRPSILLLSDVIHLYKPYCVTTLLNLRVLFMFVPFHPLAFREGGM